MLSLEDIPGFFAKREELVSQDYVFLKYRFETELDPKLAAAHLCSEQSTAQWKRPGIDEDFRPLYGAKVISLVRSEELGVRSKIEFTPPHPSPLTPYSYEVTIAHPHRNFGPRIPNLLSAAAGEGPFYCPGIQSIKWLDFELPDIFLRQFEGPQFGLKAIREQLKVWERPLFVGVVKPNIGLAPKDFASLAYQSWIGGLDIAKDDEMLADTEGSPVGLRANEVAEARHRAEEEGKQNKMFISNITDEVDRTLSLHDEVVQKGSNAVMINPVFTGLSALRLLRKRAQVPVMGHFAGTAVFSHLPYHGISSLVFTKLQRLCGADIIGIAGFGERMGCAEEEVLANIDACLKPWASILPALPIPGGSDWAGTLPSVYQKIGHADFGFISGRGVFGHPEGPTAGAQSLHQAWEAIRMGFSLSDFAKRGHDALGEALKAFGKG